MTEAALQVHNLHKIYGNKKVALQGVSLTVPKGGFYALLGPNGAGKSTMINILADIVRPGSGSASLFGHDIFQDKAWCKQNMGVVPQEISFCTRSLRSVRCLRSAVVYMVVVLIPNG